MLKNKLKEHKWNPEGFRNAEDVWKLIRLFIDKYRLKYKVVFVILYSSFYFSIFRPDLNIFLKIDSFSIYSSYRVKKNFSYMYFIIKRSALYIEGDL